MGFYLSFSTNFIIQLNLSTCITISCLFFFFFFFSKMTMSIGKKKNWGRGRVPCGPVVRTQHFHSYGPGLIPGQGTEILSAMQCSKKKRKKERKDIVY